MIEQIAGYHLFFRNMTAVTTSCVVIGSTLQLSSQGAVS